MPALSNLTGGVGSQRYRGKVHKRSSFVIFRPLRGSNGLCWRIFCSTLALLKSNKTRFAPDSCRVSILNEINIGIRAVCESCRFVLRPCSRVCVRNEGANCHVHFRGPGSIRAARNSLNINGRAAGVGPGPQQRGIGHATVHDISSLSVGLPIVHVSCAVVHTFSANY